MVSLLHTTWSQSLVLEVRSVWPGNYIPCKMNVTLSSDKKAKVPNSAQLPSLKEPGVQPNWPSDCPYEVGARSHRLQLRQSATPIRLQRQEWGRGSLFSQGPGQRYWVVLVRNLMPLQDTYPSLLSGPTRSPAGPRTSELEGLWEKGWGPPFCNRAG